MKRKFKLWWSTNKRNYEFDVGNPGLAWLGTGTKMQRWVKPVNGMQDLPPWSLGLLRQHIYKQRIKNLHRFGFGNQSTQRKPPTSRKSLTKVSHNFVSSTPDSLQLKKTQNTITKNLTNKQKHGQYNSKVNDAWYSTSASWKNHTKHSTKTRILLNDWQSLCNVDNGYSELC